MARKDDRNTKIALGGLVRQSPLWSETNQVIFGALQEAKAMLDAPDGSDARHQFMMRGRLYYSDREGIAKPLLGLSAEERTRMTHWLIRRGALVMKAGLDTNDNTTAILTGIMLIMGERLSGPLEGRCRSEWQRIGGAEIATDDRYGDAPEGVDARAA